MGCAVPTRGFVVVPSRRFRSVRAGTFVSSMSARNSACDNERRRSAISGIGSMAGSMAVKSQSCKPPVADSAHFPTNGRCWHYSAVDIRAILSANLSALMDYARDHQHPDLSTLKGIERATNGQATRTTLRGMRDGTRYVQLDTLEAVATAFDIQPWALLLPDLDPANPPIKPVSKTEAQLYQRMSKVARDYEQLLREQRVKERTPGAPRADRDSSGKVSDGKSRRDSSD